MPIVRKQDGWYWGSKGPFATKTKAIQVGQAAHHRHIGDAVIRQIQVDQLRQGGQDCDIAQLQVEEAQPLQLFQS